MIKLWDMRNYKCYNSLTSSKGPVNAIKCTVNEKIISSALTGTDIFDSNSLTKQWEIFTKNNEVSTSSNYKM